MVMENLSNVQVVQRNQFILFVMDMIKMGFISLDEYNVNGKSNNAAQFLQR